MQMNFRNLTSKNFKTVLSKYFSFKNETRSLEPLAEFLESLRKSDFHDVLNNFRFNEEHRSNFSYYIKNVFSDRSFNLSLTEANILSENSFFSELKKRILNKILPPVENEQTVWYLIDNVSISSRVDLEYLHNVPKHEIDEFLHILEISDFIKNEKVKNDLIFSMNILAWRVTGMALEVDVVRMAPEYKNFDNPFLALQNELEALAEDFKVNRSLQLSSKTVAINR